MYRRKAVSGWMLVGVMGCFGCAHDRFSVGVKRSANEPEVRHAVLYNRQGEPIAEDSERRLSSDAAGASQDRGRIDIKVDRSSGDPVVTVRASAGRQNFFVKLKLHDHFPPEGGQRDPSKASFSMISDSAVPVVGGRPPSKLIHLPIEPLACFSHSEGEDEEHAAFCEEYVK